MRRSFYILFILCSFFFRAQAQEPYKLDVDTTELEDPLESLSVDSTLTPNQLTISSDSVEKWKNLSGFEYAKYLDSLLKAKQEKEKLKITEAPKTQSSSKSSPTPASTTQTEQQSSSWLDNLFVSPVTSVILYILAGLFVAFILYKLFLGGGNPFKMRTKTLARTTDEVVEEEEVTSESDFDRLIRQSIEKGNYRVAIRYQYLKLLHRLAAKNFIEMAADKTNYQYVRELAGRGPAVNQQFQNDFASLTLSYEYVWYGEFNVDDATYGKIANGFNQFNQKICP